MYLFYFVVLSSINLHKLSGNLCLCGNLLFYMCSMRTSVKVVQHISALAVFTCCCAVLIVDLNLMHSSDIVGVLWVCFVGT